MVKKLHYIWLGGPKSKKCLLCLSTWKKYMKDWEIIEHNESNTDIDSNPVYRKLYDEGKYEFLSDNLRIDILKEEGGIYMDTDMYLVNPIPPIMYSNSFVVTKESSSRLGTGYLYYEGGLDDVLDDWKNSFNYTDPNTILLCRVLISKGYRIPRKNYGAQGGITILSNEYLYPVSWTLNHTPNYTNNTVGAHLFTGGWAGEQSRVNIHNSMSSGHNKIILEDIMKDDYELIY